MKPDDFEQRLQRVPHRNVPNEWRRDILAAANAAGLNGSSRREEALTASPQRLGKRGYLSLVTSAATQMGRELIWPNPRAWAGLAAVWVVILALKISTGNEAHTSARTSPVSPEVIAELRQQKLLLAELIGEAEVPDAKPPKRSPPRPRSDRVGETRAV
jgi:hypothetical protein